jgi:hypothetical protein
VLLVEHLFGAAPVQDGQSCAMLRDLVQPVGKMALTPPPLYLFKPILQCLRDSLGFRFPGQSSQIGSQFLSFECSTPCFITCLNLYILLHYARENNLFARSLVQRSLSPFRRSPPRIALTCKRPFLVKFLTDLLPDRFSPRLTVHHSPARAVWRSAFNVRRLAAPFAVCAAPSLRLLRRRFASVFPCL